MSRKTKITWRRKEIEPDRGYNLPRYPVALSTVAIRRVLLLVALVTLLDSRALRRRFSLIRSVLMREGNPYLVKKHGVTRMLNRSIIDKLSQLVVGSEN